jgi:nucleoid-associated protein YgaU
MTRETKVGLIVGLAFIVVFAVILSHKGNQPRAAGASDLGPLVDTSAGADGTGPSARVPTGSSGDQRADEDSVRPATPTESGTPTRLTNSVATGSRVPLPAAPVVEPDAESRETEPLPEPLNAWLGGVADSTAGADDGVRVTRVAPPVAVTPATPPAAKPTPPAPAPAETVPDADAIKPADREYVAQSGDTLTKIARRMYGAADPQIIDAILAANRNTLPDADTLRVDDKLVLPDLPADQFEAADFPPHAAPAKPETAAPDTGASGERLATADASGRYRWYTVKAKDTLGEIAQRELGTCRRWKEIHELNKDAFPDPARLPAGVKIKLPANGHDPAGTSQS